MLALIGRGQTNAEIAAELFVGEGTVKTHINHVFTKLQLRDRAAAVVFAFDHDLVAPAPDRPGTGSNAPASEPGPVGDPVRRSGHRGVGAGGAPACWRGVCTVAPTTGFLCTGR